MSAEAYQGPNAALDGQGANNAKALATNVAVAQLEANSREQRNEVRANATSFSSSQWDTLDNAVMRPLRDNLVLDQAFVDADLIHDLQWWETRSMWGLRGRMGPAQHTSDLRTPTEEDALPEADEGIAVPYEVKDYRYSMGDLVRSRQTGEALDTTYPAEAGRSVANLVEDTYLWGAKIQFTTQFGNQLGCPGLLNVQGRGQQVGSGTWDDGPQAKDDINTALGTLDDNNYTEGPTWMVMGNEQNNQFRGDYKPSVNVDVTTREKIERITDLDRMIHAPRMPDGQAVIFKATEQVIDAARLPDGPRNIEWDTHRGHEIHNKIYHLAAPRIKHADTGNNLSTGVVHISGISGA